MKKLPLKNALKNALKTDRLREFIKHAKVADDNETQSEDFERMLGEASRSKKEDD